MESEKDKPGVIFFKEFREFRLIKQLSFHGYLGSNFDTLPRCTCNLVKLIYPVDKTKPSVPQLCLQKTDKQHCSKTETVSEITQPSVSIAFWKKSRPVNTETCNMI